MPKYEAELFYQILTESIRPNVTIPFDCYLLLEKNETIVKIVRTNDVFPAEKISKLFSYEYSKLYIRNENKDAYFKYLDQFFKTTEGQAVLSKLQESGEGNPIAGLPTQDEFQLTAVQSSDESTGSIVDNANNSDNYGKINIQENSQQQDSIKVSNIKDSFGSIVEVLDENTQFVSEQYSLKSSISDEEKLIIKDITIRISEELTKIPGSPQSAKDFMLLKGGSKIILEQIDRLDKLVANKTGSAQAALKKIANMAYVSAEPLFNTKGQQGFLERGIVVKDNLKQIKSGIEILKGVIQNDEAKLIESSIERLVDELEKITGTSLIITRGGPVSQSDGRLGELIKRLWLSTLEYKDWVELSEIKNLQKFQPVYNNITSAYTASTGEPITDSLAYKGEVKEDESKKIEMQKEIIKELEARMLRQDELIQKVKKYWKTITDNKFDTQKENHLLASNGLTKSITSADFESDKIKVAARALNSYLGIEDSPLENKDPESIHDIELAKTHDSSIEELHKKALEIKLPDKLSQSNNIEEIRSENQVLLSQLENARSILESSTNQVQTLEQLLHDGDSYILQLERECDENRKEIRRSLERVESFEQQKVRFESTLDDSNKKLIESDLNLKRKLEELSEAKDRIFALQTEIKAFKPNPSDPAAIDYKHAIDELRSSLGDKERILEELTEKLNRAANDATELKKDNIKMQALVSSAEAVKKDLSSKIERSKMDLANMRQTLKGSEIKSNTLSVNLQEAKKSLAKLTTENEAIRADRVKFINMTNKSLADFKDMVSKNNRLSSQMQAKEQQFEQLQLRIEQMKDKELVINQETIELRNYIRKIQEENDHLKSNIQDFEAKVNATDLKVLREEIFQLQTKSEKEVKNSKELEKQVNIKQNEILTLNKQIKQMQIQIGRFEELLKKQAAQSND